jgi:hypothetical protein
MIGADDVKTIAYFGIIFEEFGGLSDNRGYCCF